MKAGKTRQTLISKVMDQHDEEAWSEFVSYYKDYLLRVLMKYNLSSEEVHDAVQEALVKIWKNLPNFNYDPKKGRFRSWIAQFAINEMRLVIRKNSRQDKVKDLEINEDIEQDKLEEEWMAFVAQKAWENVSPSLNEAMRQTFDLHLKGLNSSQIAEQLNIPASTARVYKKRVTYKLKYEIARLENELN